MKAIRVTFDEALLEKLDRRPAVRERGRSAVLREGALEYLKRREAEETARRYRAPPPPLRRLAERGQDARGLPRPRPRSGLRLTRIAYVGPIAALTAGITFSAISSIDRRPSVSSSQSFPA